MPATDTHKGNILDNILCQTTTFYNITRVCLVEAGTGALKDCVDVPSTAITYSDLFNGGRVQFTVSITPTASYDADHVSVRYVSGTTDLELFRTPLPGTVSTAGVSSVDVTWRADYTISATITGVFPSVNVVFVARRIAESVSGTFRSVCHRSISYYYTEVDPNTGAEVVYVILSTNLSHDRAARKAYHPITNFAAGGHLEYFSVCTGSVASSTQMCTDVIMSSSTTSPPTVSTSDAVSFEAVYTV